MSAVDSKQLTLSGRLPLGPAPQRRMAIVAAVVVIVACAAVNVVWWREGQSKDRELDAGADAASAAKSVLPDVLSYDFSSLDGYRAQVDSLTTGDFGEQLIALIDDKIAPVAKRDQIVTRATVPALAVVSVDDEDRVVVLAFVNQVTKKRKTSQPTVEGSRIVATLERIEGKWKVSKLDPV